MVVNICIVEDQPLYRQMLAGLLESVRGFNVSILVGNYDEALAQLSTTPVDVALLDLALPDGNGLDLGREIRKHYPQCGIVLMSASEQMHALLELSEPELAGWSYLSKNSSLSAPALVATIKTAAAHGTVLDPALTGERAARAGSRIEQLSPRQREILSLMSNGLTNQAIADRLKLSVSSVNNHVHALFAALNLREAPGYNTRVAAVRIFLEQTVQVELSGGKQ